MVSDEGVPPLSSTATVIIEVLDENDNSPQFSHKLFQIKLPEQQSMDEAQDIYRMVGRDDDVGPNGMITYSLEDSNDDRFDIHPETGVVTARGKFVRGNYSILTVRTQSVNLAINYNKRGKKCTFSPFVFCFTIIDTSNRPRQPSQNV